MNPLEALFDAYLEALAAGDAELAAELLALADDPDELARVLGAAG